MDLNNQKINLKKEVENPILQLRHNHYLVNLALFVVCFSPTVNETYFLVRNFAYCGSNMGSISSPTLLH